MMFMALLVLVILLLLLVFLLLRTLQVRLPPLELLLEARELNFALLEVLFLFVVVDLAPRGAQEVVAGDGDVLSVELDGALRLKKKRERRVTTWFLFVSLEQKYIIVEPS